MHVCMTYVHMYVHICISMLRHIVMAISCPSKVHCTQNQSEKKNPEKNDFISKFCTIPIFDMNYMRVVYFAIRPFIFRALNLP